MAFPTCRVCRFHTRLSAPTRWLRPQTESSKGKNWLPVASYDKYGPLRPRSVAVYSIYLFIYLFRNRAPSVPRNRRGSCSVLADRAFWASLRTARIWVYLVLIIKCKKKERERKKERKTGWVGVVSASVCGAADFSPPCGRLGPGQGACVASPSRADTCTNIKALAVPACQYHPENLGGDGKIGNHLCLDINGRNAGIFFMPFQ